MMNLQEMSDKELNEWAKRIAFEQDNRKNAARRNAAQKFKDAANEYGGAIEVLCGCCGETGYFYANDIRISLDGTITIEI